MKSVRILTPGTIIAAALVVSTAAFFLVPAEAMAAIPTMIGHGLAGIAGAHLAVPLVALKARRAELVTKAEAKRSEIKADSTAEAIIRIENEHAGILADIMAADVDIAAEEARAAPAPQPTPTSPAPLPAPAAEPAPAPAPVDASRQAVEAERARSAEILRIGGQVGLADLAQRAVADGMSVDKFRSAVIDAVAQRQAAQPEVRTQVSFADTSATDASRAAAIENALLHRSDPSYQLSAEGRQFRGMTLLEMAREVLEARGVTTRGMSRIELAAAALQTRGGGMMGTSDFPLILANIANKTLRAGYEAAPQTFRPLVRVTSVPDFKEVSRVQLGEAPQLEKVNEHGEFKRGAMGEAAEKYSVATYGKIVAITRQVLVNDEISAFTRIPRAFGVQASGLESDLVWGIITGNPAMGDGTTLFHADHKNLGTGAAIAASSVGAGREKMRTQTGTDGKTLLNIVPAYIIGPVALESTIEQFLAPIVPTKSSDAVPASLKKLTPITEPRLDVASKTNWFMAADPGMIDVIELAYLEGADGVYTETRQGFDVDGVEVKVRLDVGAKAIDWRGLFKNPN